MPGEEQLRSEGAQTLESSGQYATFYVDGLYCGVAVLRVQEVLRPQHMTRVPLAPPLIQGLINLRGQIVTAIDMRRRLRLTERTRDHAPMNLVVQGEGRAVSLLVDEIGDVIELGGDTFETPPGNLTPEQRRMIAGIHKLEGRLLLVLDIDRVLQLDDVMQPAPSMEPKECEIGARKSYD
jgi:purine-binding chemotaxis protein CheW